MKKILSIQNLSYSIPFGSPILKEISLEVNSGELIGVLGHNGSGKTTLLDLVLGGRKPTSGSVLVLEEDPHSLERKNKHHIAFLSQDVSIKGNLSIKAFLKFHASFYPNYSHEDEECLLQVFGIDRDIKVGALSTGQQKKVQIVAGFASRPELILIDEITAVLDPEARELFFIELKRIKEKLGTSIIIATNLAEDLVGCADRVLFIEHHHATIHTPSDILKLFNLGSAA